MIWWEKYRPITLDGFVGQDEIKAEMQNLIENNSMQHFIFYSQQAGTGKTTLAYILGEMLGYNVIHYNASSKRTRGIEFVEEDLIPIANSGMRETIILLDEADQLTPAAQSALKGVIEGATCFFILTCNDLSKISQWLQSRCQVRTFRPHTKEVMKDRLLSIAKTEGYTVDEEVEYICNIHATDLRNAIGALQTVCNMGEEEAMKYLQSLGEGFDSKKFLRLAFTEKDIALSAKMTGQMNMRSVVRKVFDYAMTRNVDAKAMTKVIEACIISERDLVNGVDEEIVRYDFPRMLGV